MFYWMFGETTISYGKIWNHPIETSIYKWMFQVPGLYYIRMLEIKEQIQFRFNTWISITTGKVVVCVNLVATFGVVKQRRKLFHTILAFPA